MRTQTTRTALSLVALSVVAPAQGCFDSNVGAPLALTDEDVSPPQALGFSFAWPDGTVDSTAVATSNGRVGSGTGGLVPSFNVSAAQFLADPSSIAAIYADLDFGEPNAGDVEFFADPGGAFATFTYRDAVDFFGGNPFSFQVQLNDDDSFVLRMDDRAAAEVGGGNATVVTGFTEGGGTLIDPGSIDYSALPGGLFDSGTIPTTYEEVLLAPYDLSSVEILVTPNGAGGYTTTVGTCIGFPVARDLGGACNTLPPPDPEVGIRWTPDGSGGYSSAVDPAVAFRPLLGPTLGADIDTVTLVDLGFPFTMPAGTVVTQLLVDSNGRLVLPTSATAAVFAPLLADLEGEEQIAVLWADWVTALGGGGGTIHFTTDGVGSARITWNETESFTIPPPSLTVGTFQIELFGGTHPQADSWTVCYRRTNLDVTSANVAIGASDGVVGAVEVDLFPGPATSMGGAHWELFDGTIPEVYDIQPSAPTGASRMLLATTSSPSIGTQFGLDLDGIPATAAFGGIALGFVDVSAPLGLADPANPCVLISSVDLVLPLTAGASTLTTALDLTAANSGLVGFNFVLQAVVADLTLPYGLPVVTSNGLDVTVGF